MKTIAAIMILVLSVAAPAAAASVASPIPEPDAAAGRRYTCDHQGVSRVALRTEAAPCCTGLFGCPQLLANTGLIKPKRANRT